MSAPENTVFVVDDDADVLEGLAVLLATAGHHVVTCGSGAQLLARLAGETAGCILLDLRMPGMNGLEVQRELARRGLGQPVVFLSGHGDIPVAVQAVRAGAIDFLEKPVRERPLLAAVEKALDADRERRARERDRREMRDLLASLSPRETQVADLLQAGRRTPEIAATLGLSRRTVEMHRARLLRRLGARTSAEAVRIVQRARAIIGS
ncbi:MAG TPA: response regulator [Thermoanaerobaculia bacterium]|nr:response regulator [Thermoanaerobaculia bacterium]